MIVNTESCTPSVLIFYINAIQPGSPPPSHAPNQSPSPQKQAEPMRRTDFTASLRFVSGYITKIEPDLTEL